MYNEFMNLTKKGLLIILSGPSGVGKGTIRKEIMKDETLKLFYSVSMTTRNIRAGEEDGKDYYFVSKEQFEDNISRNNLLEWAEFVGNKYGTPKDKVDEKRLQGHNVLLEIEVNGTSQVLQKCANDDVLSIFIAPPSLEELERRIRSRSTETDEVIKKRLAQASEELKIQSQYKYVVINDDLEQCVKEIQNLIKSNF